MLVLYVSLNGIPLTCQVWEATIGHLLSTDVAGMVDEIWAWDAVQNGDAGILNAPSLPATRM